MTAEHVSNQMPELASMLATKPFFKIGEVAKLIGVKPHVIRYWESEFPSIRPKKNSSGQRIYVKADIEAIVEIQNLLYNERYTISGAKQMLARRGGMNTAVEAERETIQTRALASLKDQIQELLALLQQRPKV